MSDMGPDKVAHLFNAVSSGYDQSGADFFVPIATGLLDAMPARVGERWLDIGCGTGAVLLPAAQAVGQSGRVVGIDIAEGMINRARSDARERGLGNVEFIVGGATQPPVTGPFDVIASSLVLFFLEDPGAALSAWRPLLAPGGRLGVTTFGPTDPRLEDIESVLKPYLPPELRDPRTAGADTPFASATGMEELVRSAGFTNVHTQNREIAVRFADAQQWLDFSWSTGQRAMWMAVPEAEREAVQAAAVSRFDSHRDSDGSATFDTAVRYTLANRPSNS